MSLLVPLFVVVLWGRVAVEGCREYVFLVQTDGF